MGLSYSKRQITMDAENGIFTGRFQPFSLSHLRVVRQILDAHPSISLTVGVADWKGESNKANFLSGEETAAITRLSLDHAGLTDVGVLKIPVGPEISLNSSLRRAILDHGFNVIFSGSPKTQRAVQSLYIPNLRLETLDDDDVSPPRSREIRSGIENGDIVWQSLVSEAVIPLLNNLELRARLSRLPDGEKRPWVVTGEGYGSNNRERL